MAGVEKPVHFLQIAEEDDKGEVQYLDGNNFWSVYWDHLKELQVQKPERLAVSYRGTEYTGFANETVSPGAKFIYIGRKRKASDHPDVGYGSTDYSPLKLESIQNESEDVARVPTGIFEPTYIRQVPGTNCVAVVRTTGSSSWSAIEHWINETSGRTPACKRLVLLPVTRMDAIQRLQQAEAATKLFVSLAGTADPFPEGGGGMTDGLQAAKQAAPSNATMKFEVSIGNSKPDASETQSVLETIRAFVRFPGTKKLEGTVMRPDAETGELIRDRIDFTKDKVSFNVKIVEDPDSTPNDSEIMHALTEAIQKFRDKVGDNYAQ